MSFKVGDWVVVKYHGGKYPNNWPGMYRIEQLLSDRRTKYAVLSGKGSAHYCEFLIKIQPTAFIKALYGFT